MNHYVLKSSQESLSHSNIAKTMQQLGFDNYQDFWQWSVGHRADFWEYTINRLGIRFNQPYTELLNTSQGVENARWLTDARFNITDSCFQREDQATAVIYKAPGKPIQRVSQQSLRQLVNSIANGLMALGLKPGDRIAIYMPMTLESVALYLAAIKAGLPVVTIADSFTPNEIAVRLKITGPKVLFTQDALLRSGKTTPLYAKALEANSPQTVVVQTLDSAIPLREGDLSWEAFLSDDTHFNTVIQSPDDLITVLFSSGTTGEPKAIPWTHKTPIKAISDGYYHQDIQANDVVCWPTNLGWMMGPWLVFAALANKACIALYYGVPTTADFGEFVQEAQVSMLGLIPSFVRYWKETACMEAYNWKSIRCYSSTGEVSNPIEMQYLMSLAGHKPVIEYCGGTELAGGYLSSTLVQDNIPSTFSTPALGTEFVLLDEDRQPTNKGEVFLIPPILGESDRLLNRDHFEVYYKGTPSYKGQKLRRHGDQIEQLENGYYKAQGRVDDAINLGGIKVSSVQIESVVAALDFVKESAAVAVTNQEGPGQLVVYYVENQGASLSDDRFQQVKNTIRQQLNPLFKLTDLLKIEQLPRTASNKIMRRTLRDCYEQKQKT